MRGIAGRATAAALAAVGLISAPARATIRTWPGAPPCDGTLQACIDAATANDIVEIATAGPIDESISFEKPLILRPQIGVTPSFAAFHSVIGTLSTGIEGGMIRIEGLVMPDGNISILQHSTGPLTAEIVGNRVQLSQSSGPALLIDTSLAGPLLNGDMSAWITDNTVTVPTLPDQTEGIHVRIANLAAADATVARNRIDMGGNTQGAAIGIYAQGAVDVIANQISGANFDDGIFYSALDGGIVRLFDNVVFGQAGNVGMPGAIVIDGNEATTEVLIGQNTLVNNERAISASARDDLGGYLEGGIQNNLIVGNGQGLVRDTAFTATVPDSYNLFFDNSVDIGTVGSPETPGPNSVLGDPLLDADLRPSAGSPAIDAGNTGFVPQNLYSDVAGAPRVRGAAVDIGAYEAPEPASAPIAALTALLWLTGMARYARGASRITSAPAMQIAEPSRSKRSGVTPSTTRSHASDAAM